MRFAELLLLRAMKRPARNCADPRRSQRGLTLIELIVAVALFGFVLLGIVPLFLGSVKSNYSANEYTSVNTIARDRLEQLMNMPFQDPRLKRHVHELLKPVSGDRVHARVFVGRVVGLHAPQKERNDSEKDKSEESHGHD